SDNTEATSRERFSTGIANRQYDVLSIFVSTWLQRIKLHYLDFNIHASELCSHIARDGRSVKSLASKRGVYVTLFLSFLGSHPFPQMGRIEPLPQMGNLCLRWGGSRANPAVSFGLASS